MTDITSREAAESLDMTVEALLAFLHRNPQYRPTKRIGKALIWTEGNIEAVRQRRIELRKRASIQVSDPTYTAGVQRIEDENHTFNLRYTGLMAKAEITLLSWTTSSDGSITIGHDVVTTGEMDHLINELIAELERIREVYRGEYDEARKNIRPKPKA